MAISRSSLDLIQRKRSITGRGNNPFREGGFGNDVKMKRPRISKYDRKTNIPDLLSAVQCSCFEAIKKTED